MQQAMNIIKLIYDKSPFLHPIWWRTKCLWRRMKRLEWWLRIFRVQCRLSYASFKVRKRGSNPIKVCYLVIYDSVFPLEECFRLMCEDDCFEPYIVVVPDTARGEDHGCNVFRQTFNALSCRYGSRVLSPYKGGRWSDISGEYDLYIPMNLYSEMTHEYYTIPYLASKGNLVGMTRYFTDVGTVYSSTFIALSEMHYLWRFYAESPSDEDAIGLVNRSLKLFNRIVPVGRPKLDTIKHCEIKVRKRHRVIIAPHHSMDPIGGNRFSISNFPAYAKFFLDLPDRYPGIDWVFRPHPLTLIQMIRSGRWTTDQKSAYVKKMTSYANVEFQTGGPYLDAFVNSDALIQDCASFLPEYFYSGHPQCYLLKNRSAEEEQFVKSGREVLSHTYKAYSEQDIIAFIENVVIAGKDPMKEEREKFAKEKLMFNYPHASEAIVADIKKALGRGDSEK